MKLKLYKKYFFTTALIIIISLTITVAILSVLVSNYFSGEKFSVLESNCNSVADIAMLEHNSSHFNRNLYNIIHAQSGITNADTFICNVNGEIIICGCKNHPEPEHCIHENIVLSPDIISTAAGGEYKIVSKFGKIYKSPQYIVGKPIISPDDNLIGYVFSVTSAENLKNLLKSIFRLYIFASVFPLIFMFVAVYNITYRFTRPLEMMSTAAKAIAVGDFSKRVPVISNDEIGELSVSFNNMINTLSGTEKTYRNFIANVSHELRTPMTTISGFIDGILDGTISANEQKEYLQIVSTEIKRLSRVVQSMLNLAKLESGEFSINPVKFDISTTLLNVVLAREQDIEKKFISVNGLDSLEPAELCADIDLIHQVVYNLVDNAVKFTNEHGYINFSTYNNSNAVELQIKNSGPGIDKNSLPNIFERFYKTDKSRTLNANSTGLGLYIVKNIVDIHKGTIIAESEENNFTIFKVILPKNIKEETNGRI